MDWRKTRFEEQVHKLSFGSFEIKMWSRRLGLDGPGAQGKRVVGHTDDDRDTGEEESSLKRRAQNEGRAWGRLW